MTLHLHPDARARMEMLVDPEADAELQREQEAARSATDGDDGDAAGNAS